MKILMYHQIVDNIPDEIHSVKVENFFKQMQWLHASGYRTIVINELFYKSPRLNSAKDIAITFDDGYLDFLTHAFPILHQFSFSANVFLVTGLMGKFAHWGTSINGNMPILLNWDQARELSRLGVHFGSHTKNHADLISIPCADVKHELIESRLNIENEFGHPVNTLAYPYSRQNKQTRTIAKSCGYKLACTYQPHYVGGPGKDEFQMQRVGILASDTLQDFVEKVEGNYKRRVFWYYKHGSSFLRQHFMSKLIKRVQ